ncbi:MAG: ribonuclease Z [DPANN group archaeon]|nr:ribonuclease Z [DPANN group archaeon]
MKLTFLGTSCMVPTKERAQTAMVLEHKGEYLLIDSGESVQRQFKLAGMKPSKIGRILLTHWHGDHVLGLPGLLQTLSGSGHKGTLVIYGPPGIKEKIALMLRLYEFDNKLTIRVEEVQKGVFYENREYALEAIPLRHRIACNGYAFHLKDRRRIDMKKAEALGLKEGPLLGELSVGKNVTLAGREISPDDVTYVVKGKTVAFIFDTLLTDAACRLAKDADILVCEAVYTSDLEDKAREHQHLTAAHAATIAKRAGVKKLILSHLSQRYKDKAVLLKEAKAIFSNTMTAKDFMTLTI